MSNTIGAPNAIFFDAHCPFLMCTEAEPHGHDVCPECGAVRFGNLWCRTCLTHAPISAEFRAVLLSHLGQPGEAGPE
jgi:hypothetical protein